MQRTLTLRKGITYSIDGLKFQKDVPATVPDHYFYRLIHTGLFEETPPLCCYWVRHKNVESAPRLVQTTSGEFLAISKTKPVRVTRWQWDQIKDFGCFEIVPPLETMDAFVDSGKDDFSLMIIRNQNLGDVVMCTALFAGLRDRYPKARIVFATEERFFGVFDGNDLIDDVVLIGTEEGHKYDVYVNLCGWSERMPEMALCDRIDLYGQAFGEDFPFINYKLPVLYTSERERSGIRALDRSFNSDGRPVALVTPFGSGPHRSIHPEAAQETAEWLSENGFHTYIVGNTSSIHPHFRNELGGNRFTSKAHLDVLWDRLSLREFFAMVEASSLVVCPDTGTYHVAAAFDVPAVISFTTISEHVRISNYPRAYAVRAHEVTCSPCWDRPCRFSMDVGCVKAITGARLIEKCKEVMQEGFEYREQTRVQLPFQH